MASDFGYVLTRKAEADVDEIIEYFAVELSNLKAASDFMDKLMMTIGRVCAFPEMGSAVENEFLSNSAVRKLPIDNYLIYYIPSYGEHTIYVLRVVYGRRNISEILRTF